MRKKISILLAEDDKVDAVAVKRAFKKNHITNPLYMVQDGEEALAFLRNEGKFADPESSPRPGLILLDLNMPRMSGIEFLRIVKRDPDLCTIPIVALTTSAEKTDIMSSFENGVAGYLVKPVKFEAFVQSIETIDRYWRMSELP